MKSPTRRISAAWLRGHCCSTCCGRTASPCSTAPTATRGSSAKPLVVGSPVAGVHGVHKESTRVDRLDADGTRVSGPESTRVHSAVDRVDADGTRVSGPESTRVHSAVDRLDADGTRVLAPESTNPATPLPPQKTPSGV